MTKIRLKYGDNEIEIDGTDSFITSQLKDFHARIRVKQDSIPGKSIKEELLAKQSKTSPKNVPTPAEFYKSKGKRDGMSKLLIFGKYMEDYRDTAEFSRGDINGLAKEAKFPKDIHTQYFTNAVKQGLLRKSGSRYSLTLSAEELLASM